jgi:glutathione S-transferase kappa 1
MVKVEFVFDAISPYTFLAWRSLRAYRDVWRLKVEFKPVYLPGVIRGSGNVPPLGVEAKKRWMRKDIERSVRWYGIDGFQGVPVDFAARTTESARVQRLLAVVVEDENLSETVKWRMLDGTFSAYWLNPNNRQGDTWVALDDEFLRGICRDVGLSESFIETANTTGRALLARNTEEAVQRGFFGSPTSVFHADELGRASTEASFTIFGSDRFEQAAFLLNKKWLGPIPPLQEKAGMTACKL